MPKLYRITLPVGDLAQAVGFYRSLFGESGMALGPGWHSFDYAGATLLLREVADAVPHREPLYLAVDEPLIQVHYRAQGLGAQTVTEPGALPSGEQGFLVSDPFGNTIYVVDARSVPWHLQRGAGVGAAPGEVKTSHVAVEGMTLTLQRDFLSAVKGGDLDVVRDLLTLDPELIAATDPAGVSALMLAAYKQQWAVVEHLLRQDPELNVWEAAAVGRAERLSQLLKFDPRPTVYSADGFTPLGLACFFGYPECVKLLLQSGADPNAPARNEMQVRPIHSAVARAHEETVVTNVRALIGAGADVNATQKGGYTALHSAADRGFEDVVRVLLGAGARSDLRAANGRLPAHLARAKGHTRVVELLVAGV